jgi:hypothetical protein
MKTDELIAMLGTNVEAVKGGQLRNALAIALAVGAVTAVCLMLAVLGPPNDALGSEYIATKLVTLAFTLALVAAGASFLMRAARPGKPGRRPLIIVGLLFLAIVSAGIVVLLVTHPVAWGALVFGPQWAACLFCIPLFSLTPFAVLVLALRRGAPTNLTLTGAMTGLVAGALGAAAVAIHHPGGSLPFIAFWYGGPIALCALAGAFLGPRLLRW